jgi:hypothetical protein
MFQFSFRYFGLEKRLSLNCGREITQIETAGPIHSPWERRRRGLLSAIPAIRRIASGYTPPFIAGIYKDGRAEMQVREEELKKDKK